MLQLPRIFQTPSIVKKYRWIAQMNNYHIYFPFRMKYLCKGLMPTFLMQARKPVVTQ